MNTYIGTQRKITTDVNAPKSSVSAITGATVRDNSGSSRAVWFAFTLVGFALLLAFPDTVRGAVILSLRLCATKLIPSLFPFAVLGELAVMLGLAELFGSVFARPFKRFFGISGIGAAAFFIGAVCGLPLGGKYAVSLYENGSLSKEECEYMCGTVSNTGLGFTVIGIGSAIFGSIGAGIVIYCTQLISAIAVGIVSRPKQLHSIAPVTVQTQKKSFPEALALALSDAALSMVRICGCVIFFSVIAAFTESVCDLFKLPRTLCALLLSLTEITSACSYVAKILPSVAPVTAQTLICLLFFAVGFTGMSAHIQLATFAYPHKLSLIRHYASKLTCGVLCACIGAFIMLFCDGSGFFRI